VHEFKFCALKEVKRLLLSHLRVVLQVLSQLEVVELAGAAGHREVISGLLHGEVSDFAVDTAATSLEKHVRLRLGRLVPPFVYLIDKNAATFCSDCGIIEVNIVDGSFGRPDQTLSILAVHREGHYPVAARHFDPLHEVEVFRGVEVFPFVWVTEDPAPLTRAHYIAERTVNAPESLWSEAASFLSVVSELLLLSVVHGDGTIRRSDETGRLIGFFYGHGETRIDEEGFVELGGHGWLEWRDLVRISVLNFPFSNAALISYRQEHERFVGVDRCRVYNDRILGSELVFRHLTHCNLRPFIQVPQTPRILIVIAHGN